MFVGHVVVDSHSVLQRRYKNKEQLDKFSVTQMVSKFFLLLVGDEEEVKVGPSK